MHKLMIFIAIAFFGGLWGCSSPQEFPAVYKQDQIHFGQGGGFTGGVTYYVLLEDGRVFQRGQRDTTMTYLEKWSPGFTEQMFTNFTSLHLHEISFNEPGDLYYFIDYRSPGHADHRLTWGRNGFKPDPNATRFYNLLFKSIKSQS
jgi:hypothetical protein